MDKTYQPKAIESLLYKKWEDNGYFKPGGKGDSYCIMIPPPNVTGSLHMGHGFNNAVMDTLVRYRRMQGRNTLWQPGTDHAGIATQMVVERQLATQNITRHDLGREKFIDKVWEWKKESGGAITQQIRRLGSSVDWSRERFTMDEGLSEAVKEAFVQLHEQGLIYRGKRLVNWDPKLHTAISDLEVISEEEKGSLWHLKYPVENSNEFLIVATTRPETMLGDSAVAVHPEDERYKHLIGKQVKLPITERLVPIIADEYVDREFGTGVVKITPAHDFNDYEVGKRHNLPLFNIFTRDATIINNTDWPMTKENLRHAQIATRRVSDIACDIGIPEKYWGLDRFVARKQIVADLEAQGLVDKIDPHILKIPRGDRSGVVVEPWLTDQWYVSTQPLAKEAIKVVEEGQIQFVPKQYENMYYAWMRDIQDWCISRQLWWGHRIPAWYDNEGNVYVGRNETEVRTKHNLKDIELKQDEDVLDTWFSSALWTFSTLGWPEQTAELKTFHPTDVLVTGFDIIFFWVARMIMMTTHFMKNDDGSSQVPFKTVYVHGLVRDAQGQKMSKSKGNVLDPIDLIDGIELETLVKKRTTGMMQPQLAEKITKATRKEFPDGLNAYGTDALRFTFLSLASTGRDIKFDVGRIEGFRNFCNKIWNASRYVWISTADLDCGQDGSTDYELSLADRWIISRLQQTESEITKALDEFRFDQATQIIYDFFWNDYCDWYLEFTKPILLDGVVDGPHSPSLKKKGTRRTLIRVLEVSLRLMHPMMPFITEEIWQRFKGLADKSGDTIMLQSWPVSNPDKVDKEAEADIEWLKQIILAVRNIRGEMNISPGKQFPIYLRNCSDNDLKRLKTTETFLKKIANLEHIHCLKTNEEAPMSATGLAGQMEVLVPMAGLIDKEAEVARLNKEIDKLNKEAERLKSKLANEKFVSSAPAEVVNKEKTKLADTEDALSKLAVQILNIHNL